jgi:hypothetical protein
LANVLMTWELGGGLGHMVRLAPLAEHVRAAGHRVVVALRDVSRARGVFGRLDVELLQAPVQTRVPANAFATPLTLAHLLHNVGFGSESELWGTMRAWRTLYDMVRPDVIAFDHSPTALLAARGRPGVRRVVIGSGFFCPPDETPLPNLHPWINGDPAALAQDEQRVLGVMNRVLGDLGGNAMERVTQMYRQVDATLLTTFEELDHYPHRDVGAKYWGAWTEVAAAKRVDLPDGDGARIFAYLKATKGIEEILAVLAASEQLVVAVVEGLKRDAVERIQGERMRVETEPLNLREVGAWCDFALLNGNHGTTAAVLRLGKPVVELPIFLEQAMLARAVVRMGAGLEVSVNQPKKIAEAIRQMVESPKEQQRAARAFAERCAKLDEAEAIRRVAGEIVRI